MAEAQTYQRENQRQNGVGGGTRGEEGKYEKRHELDRCLPRLRSIVSQQNGTGHSRLGDTDVILASIPLREGASRPEYDTG
tara:strand:+ start:566 stop:808 length:243 start_codon:yes stop_codon:yes gene_type:complete